MMYIEYSPMVMPLNSKVVSVVWGALVSLKNSLDTFCRVALNHLRSTRDGSAKKNGGCRRSYTKGELVGGIWCIVVEMSQ